MKTDYTLMSWVEAQEAARSQRVVLLPIGSVDANGAQTPMGFDYLVATALARRAAERCHDIWMPAIAYGVSEDLDGFPGTIAIPAEELRTTIYRVLRSLVKSGFRHILLVTNHGPNQYPAEFACRQARRELGILIGSINPAQLAKDLAGDLFPDHTWGHGAEPGSSLLMHLFPGSVRDDLAHPALRSHFQGLEVLGPSEVRHGASRVNLFLELEEVSPTSGWADPTLASPEKGETLFARMLDYVAGFLEVFRELDTAAPPPEISAVPIVAPEAVAPGTTTVGDEPEGV